MPIILPNKLGITELFVLIDIKYTETRLVYSNFFKSKLLLQAFTLAV